jgi:signal transduction histidine kinase
MQKLLTRLGLRRIGVQIATLVVVPPLAIHLVITTLFLLHRGGEPPEFDRPDRDLGALVRVIAATPASDRPALIERIGQALPRLALAQIPADTVLPANENPAGDPGLHLGQQFKVYPLAGPGPARIAIRLPDGATMAATANSGPWHGPMFFGPWTTALLSIVISISLLSLWVARTLTAPISGFARAAESFSLDSAASPLAETGPEEIRLVAGALNRMRERITALMRDRTQMLAAISHDLRTPITRLRLRSEFIEDQAQRGQTLQDLDQMRSMLESVLALLRNDHAREPVTLVDLPAMLQLINDQFADLGHDVAFAGPPQAALMARPDDLSRAVTNLVENAVRYGAHVRLGLAVLPNEFVIDVEDDGPGIADARKADMIEPFVRGDDARNLDGASGFGLGLSIARSIVIAHGGTLSLHDRQPHGLTARITLPARAGQSAVLSN